MQTKKRGTIDRFEGDYALVELPDKTMLHIARTDFISPCREGDKVYQTAEGRWHKDEEATASERARIHRLLDELWE